MVGALVAGSGGAAFADGHGRHDSYGNNSAQTTNSSNGDQYGDHRHHHHQDSGGGSGPVSSTLYVSPAGQPSNAGGSCTAATFSTIQSAVNAAAPGSTIVVCAGTYTEDVVVATPLSLVGQGAVIQGSPTANGMCDQLGPTGPGSAPCLAGVTIKSSNVSFTGFTVQGAIGEGILVTGSLAGGSIDHVTVENNQVIGNNTGGIPPVANSPYPQCSAFGQIPGDCGEGIHLMGADYSTVSKNFVSANEGGVLLTDEFGPTHDNTISANVITQNAFDCGITVPGHNPNALDASGNRQPDVAGVYRNMISFNAVTNNGLQGEGAGVLFANAAGNRVVQQHRGVQLPRRQRAVGRHDARPHARSGPVRGPRRERHPVQHHREQQRRQPGCGPGDPLDGPPAQDFQTTGILVFGAGGPLPVNIADNVIFDDSIGVWLGVNGNVNASLDDNFYAAVTTPVFTAS